ncbi:MAG: chorismate dehydratase [Myxococcota bacterium]|jgi:chorismate dehydratase
MKKIATVGYVNAIPLTAKLDRERYDVIADVPANIAKQLTNREVDVALVPVATVLANPQLRIVPGQAIGADGAVTSVLLVAETEPEEWTELCLDGESRTSAMLTRTLLTGPFGERLRDDLIVREIPQGTARDTATGTIASLVIGDAARELPDRLTVRLDLGQLWKDWTKLPFVFAVWAAYEGLDAQVRQDLRSAAVSGLADRAQLVAPDDVDYVTNAIRYEFDDRALMGLRRFAALAERAGLIADGHVNLFGPTYVTVPAKADVNDLLLALLEGRDVDIDGLTTLLEHGPVAVLGLAADEKRREADASNTVRYIVSEVAPDTILAADLHDLNVRKALIDQSHRGDLPCLYLSVGALDTPQDRASLLLILRDMLAQCPKTLALAPVPIAGPTVVDHTASDALRFTAVARLFLSVPLLAAPLGSYHMDVLQTRLRMGCAAIVPVTEDQVEDVERHIREAGFIPVPCDQNFQPSGHAQTDGAAIFRRQPWARVGPPA